VNRVGNDRLRPDWGAPVSTDEMQRRASGRRRYNSWRRTLAALRRVRVAELLAAGLRQADIARQLGVCRATISGDVAALVELANRTRTCPVCGQQMQWRAGGGDGE